MRYDILFILVTNSKLLELQIIWNHRNDWYMRLLRLVFSHYMFYFQFIYTIVYSAEYMRSHLLGFLFLLCFWLRGYVALIIYITVRFLIWKIF